MAKTRSKTPEKLFIEAPCRGSRRHQQLGLALDSVDNSARILNPGSKPFERFLLRSGAAQVHVAQRVDAESIVDLINAAFKRAEGHIIDRDRIDLATVESLFAKGQFLVGGGERKLVGCVYLEPRGERTYLGLLCVMPRQQGAGIGSRLMAEAERRCTAAGVRFMDLRIANLREENQAFYKKRGYIETGTEPFPSEIATRVPVHFVNMSKQLR